MPSYKERLLVFLRWKEGDATPMEWHNLREICEGFFKERLAQMDGIPVTEDSWIVVTATIEWDQLYGIDIWDSCAFRDEPVGASLKGWTVAWRGSAAAEAERVRQESHRQGRSAMVLIFPCGQDSSC